MDWRKKILKGKGKDIWNGNTDYLLSDGLAGIALSRGCSLTDIRIIPKSYGALLVLRFGRTSEGPKIAFYGGKTAAIAAHNAALDLEGDMEKLKEDEWAMRRLDESE